MTAVRFAGLTIMFVAGTIMVGWWALPVVGACWGLMMWRDRRPALTAALAAGSAWGALLLWDAAGPVGKLTETLGKIAGVPGVVFVAATLALAVLLAGLSARVVRRG